MPHSPTSHNEPVMSVRLVNDRCVMDQDFEDKVKRLETGGVEKGHDGGAKPSCVYH
jgi:hypothetical protein